LIEAIEQHLGTRPRRRFPLHQILIPLGIVFCVIGFFISLGSVIAMHMDPLTTDTAGGQYIFTVWLAWGVAPITIGFLAVIFGKWWCCGMQAEIERQAHFRQGIGESPVPKSRRATFSLCFGLLSSAWNLLAALPALVLGVWALAAIRRRSGWLRGRETAIAGIACALLGTTLSTVFLWLCWHGYQGLQCQEAAFQLLQASKPNDAIEDLDEALRRRPGARAWVLKYRGIAYLQLGDLQAAVDELSNAINAFPSMGPQSSSLAETFYFRSVALERMGRPQEAEQDIQSARVTDLRVLLMLQSQDSLVPLTQQRLDPPDSPFQEVLPMDQVPPAPPAPDVSLDPK
jgi:hypothetical protein